jgi:ribosomal protein S15P/S13E
MRKKRRMRMAVSAKVFNFVDYYNRKNALKNTNKYKPVRLSEMSEQELQETMEARRDED